MKETSSGQLISQKKRKANFVGPTLRCIERSNPNLLEIDALRDMLFSAPLLIDESSEQSDLFLRLQQM